MAEVKFNTAKEAYIKGFNVLDKGTYTLMYRIDGVPQKEKLGYQNELPNKFDKGFILAPTQTQLQKWLRENHNIHIAVNFSHSLGRYDYTVYASNEEALDAQLYKIDNDVEEWCKYTCYEDALEDALVEGLSKIKTV